MKWQLYTKWILVFQIIFCLIGCSANDISQSIILTQKSGKIIIVTAPREIAHFEEYLNKLQQVSFSEVPKLPEKILASVNEVFTLRLKDKILIFKNEGVYLESHNQVKKVSCSSGLYHFIHCLNSVSEKNKESFKNGIILEFDSFRLIDTNSNSVRAINSKELVNSLKKALIEGSRDFREHLSYIDFSHYAILRRYEILFYNDSEYVGGIEFESNPNSYIKFTYTNEDKMYEVKTLTFLDKKNYIRKSLNQLLENIKKDTTNK